MSLPVSIVIPVHNGRELLEKLLESIARQTVQPLEIIVVDNASSDGAAESALRAGAEVLRMSRNAGFAAAVNRGILEAKGEAIALINSDVELDSRWLEVLWGSGTNAADFATGTIFKADSVDGRDILDGSYDLISRAACSWRAGEGRPASVLPELVQPIRFCSATAAIYRATLFREIGMFEESFESYLEDVDFGLRCAAAGRTGNYLPGAVCWHRGSATFGRWNPRVVRLIARNQILLIARHYPAEMIRRWFWPILAGQALWGVLAIRQGCGIAWLSGKITGIRRFRSARQVADPRQRLESVIIETEREIHRLQSRAGFDTYWKFYFRLAGSAK